MNAFAYLESQVGVVTSQQPILADCRDVADQDSSFRVLLSSFWVLNATLFGRGNATFKGWGRGGFRRGLCHRKFLIGEVAVCKISFPAQDGVVLAQTLPWAAKTNTEFSNLKALVQERTEEQEHKENLV